jgi:(E)-4-hydroxy-3-methylbut-2-enyl-diphosphate synthase
MNRKLTRKIQVGNVTIGGGAPIVIQSMTNTDPSDTQATLAQIQALSQAGCQIVRCTVPDQAAVKAMGQICEQSPIPVVADIHFDYRLAIESAYAGVSKIRINPGNIGGRDRVKAVTDICREKKIPIRIGVNSGSVEKEILQKYGAPTPEALVESALSHVRLLEQEDFTDICISLKSSSVPATIKAYQIMSQKVDYPLHLGVTEAGTERMGLLKSAAGIGGLLAMGIGDTIRVSLTADPVREIYGAKDILKAVGLSDSGVNVVSCPTCGRTKIDLIGIASEVEERLAKFPHKMTVAVMGCVVNGPGEAREADFGIAGGDGVGLVFRHGEILRKVPESDLVNALLEEMEKAMGEQR